MVGAKWGAATNAGRAALLSSSEQASYGVIYHNLALVQQLEMEEQTTWAHLRALEYLNPIPSDAIVPMTMALPEAKLDTWHIGIYFRRSLAFAAQLGIRPGASPYRGSPSVCLPIDTPRDLALREIRARVGPGNYFSEP